MAAIVKLPFLFRDGVLVDDDLNGGTGGAGTIVAETCHPLGASGGTELDERRRNAEPQWQILDRCPGRSRDCLYRRTA